MSDDSFREYVLDQLRGLDGVTCRAMFGGHGLYLGGAFFGIVFEGRFYLKTDAESRPEYERRGSKPFRPNPRQTLGWYYEAPPEILEDAESLCAWARRAARAG